MRTGSFGHNLQGGPTIPRKLKSEYACFKIVLKGALQRAYILGGPERGMSQSKYPLERRSRGGVRICWAKPINAEIQFDWSAGLL
jgi:hypothetical protein